LKAFMRLREMGLLLSAQQVPGGREYLLDDDQIQQMGEQF